jgi:uncharacterized protein YutE (UPF0331/DUF86 family)
LVHTNGSAFVPGVDGGPDRRDEVVHAREAVVVIAFYNLLVRGYADVDDHRVDSYLDRLKDLDTFVAALTMLLNG